jgi:ABC-type transport system involved in cytochrome c biogenesis permease subunit
MIFFGLAFLFYAAAFVLFFYYLLSKREVQNRLGMTAAVLGWICQTAALALRGIEAGHLPVVGAFESITALTWAVVTLYLVLEWLTRIKALGIYIMLAVCALLAIAWGGHRPPLELMPALRSDIVAIHVAVIFTALAAFVVAGGGALLYLIEDSVLKRRRPGAVVGRLPSLRTLHYLMTHAAMFGLPFLSMGIAAGIIRAESFGVRHWWQDAVVLLAAGAWLVYAILVYGHLAAGWRGRYVAYLALVGLGSMLAIRLVAVPYLSDFHHWGG